MAGPMSGIKVVDLGTMIAGPMASTVLCDQGADVIKVEAPGVGDLMRYLGASCNGVGSLYHNCNRGKRSLAVDLKTPEGVSLVKQLAAEADVVLQNFRPGVAERLGVDYTSLQALNPGLVYLSVCGFGDKGPYANKAAYDNVIQAFAGVARSQTNPQTGEPIQYYQLFSDKLTALTGSQAISSALFARERGQGGQHIRLSMVDSVASFLWADLAGTSAFTNPQAREGMALSKGLRLLQFKDGYGSAAPVNDAQFQGYCKAFGEDASDARFATVQDRNNNADELQKLMRRVFATAATMTTAEAIAAMEAEDVPCAQAMHLEDLPQHPQMQANKSFSDVSNPLAGTIVEPNNPPNFEGTPSPSLRTCATVGEHSEEILLHLGYTPAGIRELREIGVVG